MKFDQRWRKGASVCGVRAMIAKVRDVTVFVGLMVYVVSIASLFRIGDKASTTQVRNFEITLANCVARFT